MSERQGVEIDYCPQCRGVWLDRGELDKLIERSAAQEAPRAAPVEAARPYPPQQAPQHPPQQHYRRDFEDSDFNKRGQGHYRKKSWLSDIFD
jgi:Zn-finger nucleic acid-binding protein